MSVATVSRVMNGQPVVRAETVARVRAAMRKLGYRPAPANSRRGPKPSPLAALRFRAAAFIWTHGHGAAETLAGHELLEGAAAAMRQYGINMLVDYLNADIELPPLLRDRKVDGVLLHGPPPDDEAAAILRTLPAVWIFYQGGADWGDRVQPDHRRVGRKALEYLLARDCRRVAVMSSPPTWEINTYHTERADGFEQLARYRGVHCVHLEREPLTTGAERALFDCAGELVDEFLALRPRPGGIFVANSLGAYVHEHLSRSNVVPMRDVLLVAGDVDRIQRHLDPEPVLVDIKPRAIGQLAVQLLLARLAMPDTPRVTQLVEPDLILPRS